MCSKWENVWQDKEIRCILPSSCFLDITTATSCQLEFSPCLLNRCTEWICTVWLKLPKRLIKSTCYAYSSLISYSSVEKEYKIGEKSIQYLIWKADQAYSVNDSDIILTYAHIHVLQVNSRINYFIIVTPKSYFGGGHQRWLTRRRWYKNCRSRLTCVLLPHIPW